MNRPRRAAAAYAIWRTCVMTHSESRGWECVL